MYWGNCLVVALMSFILKSSQFSHEQIKKVGLLISEYPNDVPPLAYYFPWRDRIIAALAKEVVVIEAKIKSGTMLTVNHALELGKEVYVLPHRTLTNGEKGVIFSSSTGGKCLDELPKILKIYKKMFDKIKSLYNNKIESLRRK